MKSMTTADLDHARLRGTTSRRSSPLHRAIAVQRS